ncbi:hypothetical protein FC652_20290 [Vibrio sp. 05-20-BW147]|uniref:hypothetical protein n=1 Tax=Vibrio sp. 05-20-BW147 TaxID=2575834 RepID=UPI001593259C|nr:hypothetical protein [Vibrio sp. 05-20-BW147]NVC65414.1 hypothetical protein [Vibrio sp. 05-20-BW147]
MHTKESVSKILDFANAKLAQHPEYEEWMVFDGADVHPNGKIVPRFKTKNGKSGFSEPKFPVYQEVWVEAATALGL